METKDILAQSKAAYGQWCVQWREQAKFNSKFKMKPLTDFENTGVGKAILCVANGYSFEENIELIKKYQHNVDILACDKTFGHLVSNGIKPKYLMLCDANVDYERYLKPYLDQTSDTILFSSVCANPKWIDGVKWKDVYFFVNKDILQSEKEFSGLSGCTNFIPAGTNVSNAMVVLLTQSDNGGRRNFFGYDKILLIGFDYSWRAGKKYYSFNETADNKANYMCHAYIVLPDGSFAYTSGNLAFSAGWLGEYAKHFQLPLVQCTKASITSHMPYGDLEKQLQYKYRVEDSAQVKKVVGILRQLNEQKRTLENQLAAIGKDHWYQHVATS
jgi:hypothetical protein